MMLPLFIEAPSCGQIDGRKKGTPILIDPDAVEMADPMAGSDGAAGYQLHVGGRAVAWVPECLWKAHVMIKPMCAGGPGR